MHLILADGWATESTKIPAICLIIGSQLTRLNCSKERADKFARKILHQINLPKCGKGALRRNVEMISLAPVPTQYKLPVGRTF